MRGICKGKCSRSCKQVAEEHRQQIWKQYWEMDYTSRRKWFSKHVTLIPIKRRQNDALRPRTDSRCFTLTLPDFTEVPVCRLMFLNTLGYSNDSVITQLIKAVKSGSCGVNVQELRGGSHRPISNRDIIEKPIESFKACVSHYRRINAPNVRYLPWELTLKIMFEVKASKHFQNGDL